MLDIHIIGTGAMACLWASYFPANVQLHFIQRQSANTLFRFQKKPQGQWISGHCVSKDTLRHPIKYLIVATKAYDAKDALEGIQQHLTENTQILLLQNGMGSQQTISKQYPHHCIYACSSTEGAYKEDSNTLVHAGRGTNNIGPMTQKASHQELNHWLPTECFQWHQDIEPVLWRKLIINSAINPLTVIHQCKNGELITQNKAHQHMKAICYELDTLLEKMPFTLPSAYSMAEQICKLTANNFSSMYQDWQHDKPTEINYITGFVVKTCQELSIPCPENQQVLKQVEQLNLGP